MGRFHSTHVEMRNNPFLGHLMPQNLIPKEGNQPVLCFLRLVINDISPESAQGINTRGLNKLFASVAKARGVELLLLWASANRICELAEGEKTKTASRFGKIKNS